MVQRKCDRCNKVFTRKSTYEYHINRVNECVPQIIDIEAETKKLEMILAEQDARLARRDARIAHLESLLKLNNISDNDSDDGSSNQIVNSNAGGSTNNGVINNGTINGNINNTPTTNNVSIQLVVHGDEHKDEKLETMIQGILKKSNFIYRDLLYAINFNEDYPNYHNKYINDSSRPNAQVYKYANSKKTGKWQTVPKAGLIDETIDVLDTIIQYNMEFVDDKSQQKIQKKLDKYESDAQYRKQIKQEISCILNDNKDMVITLRKKMEKDG